ncbi:MAG: DUF4062 domain-containing protein [Verrucomicrobia bacterium]|nr:DUF4062 domain-containing protein [Verrucomicrobiota bacterium]
MPQAPAPPSSAAPWKARPVLISSTGKDLQSEHHWLNTRVLPRIREELAKRMPHLAAIGLQPAAETALAGTDEARGLRLLKGRLEEIKRSRPFLLVLLGDRYGWVPPAARLKAAAREQGLATFPAGKSLTALEIEFGILKEIPEQKHRCLCFFRQPLPYDQMPENSRADYSDAHSHDPQVRAAHAKLEALKDKLRRDPDLAGRTHDYSAEWNPQTSEVTGLDAFCELVFEQLWAVIDREIMAFAAPPAPTWEEQERAALDEFVVRHSRSFGGRVDIIARLLAIAHSPTAEGEIGYSDWGACVTGPPDSATSTLFAKLHRDLASDPSLLLLANAAGGTPRGPSVDSMLRRWIGELAIAAGLPDPLPTPASDDAVEAAFYSLLGHVAAQRRVVMLLDSLDQAEPSPRGLHLTWFKAFQWPANARIIATAIPCPATAELLQWAGSQEIEVPSLPAADAAVSGKRHSLRVVCDDNAGDLLRAQGDLAGALHAYRESLAVSQRRAQTDPANVGWQRTLSESHLKVGDVLRDQGDLDGTLRHYSESQSIARRLAASDPANAACQRDLSVSLEKLGDLAVVQGDLAGALPPFTESKTIRERLAASDPTHALWQRDLWMSNGKLGDLANSQGNLGDSSRFWTKASEIAQRLTAGDPANGVWQRDLAVSLNKLGDLAAAQGDLAGALRAFTDGQTITHRLAASDPAKAEWQRDLSVSLEKLGDLAVTQGDLAGARHAFTRRQTIAERLAASDPANAGWQRDLSVSLNKLGSLAMAQGDLAGASHAFTESKSIRERLAASDPANATWQRDLSVSLGKLGEVAAAQGDQTGAMRAFTESKTIAERLAASDPANAAWQRDLWVSHWRLAKQCEKCGKAQDAAGWWRKAHATLAAMQRRGLFVSAQDEMHLSRLAAMFGATQP